MDINAQVPKTPGDPEARVTDKPRFQYYLRDGKVPM